MELRKGRAPLWSRPALFRRGADVRTLKRDRLCSREDCTGAAGRSTPPTAHARAVAEAQSRTEKHVAFLKQQHRDTLALLHAETERLKAENRDLNFKLVMCRCGGGGGKPEAIARRRRKVVLSSTNGEDTDSNIAADELRAILLEEEARELRSMLATEKRKNVRLMRVIEQKILEQKSDQSDAESPVSARLSTHPLALSHHLAGGRVTGGGGGGDGKPLNSAECEHVIKHLQQKTVQQSHELTRIKADLRDVLFSHKWSPDAYLMARAYVSGEKEAERREKGAPDAIPTLPEVSKQGVNREIRDKAYQRVHEELSLPALRPKVPVLAAERQRRAQAVKPGGGGRGGGREMVTLQ